MTIEQIEHGNKIYKLLTELKRFHELILNGDGLYKISTIVSKRNDKFLGESIEYTNLNLEEYPKLSLMIGDCILKQIAELEKQLDEL